MIDAVVARLKSQVPDLNGRVEEAAFIAELQNKGRMPQGATAVVVPSGLQGGKAEMGAGFYHQAFTETASILLVANALDQTGKRALERLRPLIMEVIDALVGWAPSNELGVFRLARGRMLSMTQGRIFYQIDMVIDDQLRKAT